MIYGNSKPQVSRIIYENFTNGDKPFKFDAEQYLLLFCIEIWNYIRVGYDKLK